MSQAIQVLDQIHAHGSEIADDSTVRITPDMIQVGRFASQGDVNFIFLDHIPEGVVTGKPVSQLAPGNTMGSRHCIKPEHLAHVDFFVFPSPNPLEGPVLRFNRETEIEHPEHGNHIYPAGTIVAVTFQRKHAKEVKRIQD